MESFKVKRDAQFFRESAIRTGTALQYANDFERFEAWCKAQNYERSASAGYTSSAIAEFLASLFDTHKASTIKKYAYTIASIYRTNGWPAAVQSDEVRQTLKGIVRLKGNDLKQKKALTWESIRAMVDVAQSDTRKREYNTAILLFGFCSAFRSSEIAALKWEHIEYLYDGKKAVGIRVNMPDSKTGHFTRIIRAGDKGYCPVKAMQDLEAIAKGEFCFESRQDKAMNPRSYGRILKRFAVRAGIVAAGKEIDIGGHSTRRGVITHLADMNYSTVQIMKLSGHKSHRVMLRYVEDSKQASQTPVASTTVDNSLHV